MRGRGHRPTGRTVGARVAHLDEMRPIPRLLDRNRALWKDFWRRAMVMARRWPMGSQNLSAEAVIRSAASVCGRNMTVIYRALFDLPSIRIGIGRTTIGAKPARLVLHWTNGVEEGSNLDSPPLAKPTQLGDRAG